MSWIRGIRNGFFKNSTGLEGERDAGKTDACDEGDDTVAESGMGAVCAGKSRRQTWLGWWNCTRERREKTCKVLLVGFEWQSEGNGSPGKVRPSEKGEGVNSGVLFGETL